MNATFDVVFAVFVLAIIGLAVTAVRWGVRRDRARSSRRPVPEDLGDPVAGPGPEGTRGRDDLGPGTRDGGR